MKNKTFFLVWILLLPFTLFAQNKFETNYNQGKIAYDDKNYEEALLAFNPIIQSESSNQYRIYALYYTSLSNYKLKKFKAAKTNCLLIKDNYSSFAQMDEVDFLLASTEMELHNYRSGLELFAQINTIQPPLIKETKKYFLQRITIDTLTQLQSIYTKDAVIAEVLYQKLKSKTVRSEKEEILSAYLAQEYSLSKKSTVNTTKKRVKEEYHIALLLPFNIQEMIVTDVKNQNNNSILELYQGMLIAMDSLKETGVNIHIHPYDTKKDLTSFQKIVSDPQLKKMDLWIGPLVPSQLDYAIKFTEQNNIPMINPISLNSKLVESHPSVLLFQPALESYAKNIADVAVAKFIYRKNVTKDDDTKAKKEVVVLYSLDQKDTVLAKMYKDSITQRGFKVTKFLSVSKSTIAKVATKIYSDSLGLLRTSHVVVFASDPAIASYVISQSEISRQSVPIVVKSDWLEYNITYDQFERRNVYFIYPDYIAFDNPNYKYIVKEYKQKHAKLPTKYFYQSYDMMLMIGNAMKEKGVDFFDYIKNSPNTKGCLLEGYAFNSIAFNQYVPIVYFEKLQLKIANPIYDTTE
jgi:ABC-type branched-subunit amino acid transport system substrate-binding protein